MIHWLLCRVLRLHRWERINRRAGSLTLPALDRSVIVRSRVDTWQCARSKCTARVVRCWTTHDCPEIVYYAPERRKQPERGQ